MDHPGFWSPAGPFPLSKLAAYAGAQIPEDFESKAGKLVVAVKALDDAGDQHVSFFENRKYLAALKETRAGAIFLTAQNAKHVPAHAVPLVSKDPYRSFAKSLELFFPDAGFPKVASAAAPATALIDPSARIEEGAIIEAGAIIGPEAQIGRGTRIAAGAVAGFRVTIGRDCYIGPGATVTHALIGNRVVVHAG